MKNKNDKSMEPSDFLDEDIDSNVPTILVVEDEVDYRWLIVSGLQDEYRVVEASNGKEGLEKTNDLIPDLVVTDLMMPTMDGIELCRRLKTDMVTSHIPVIMLTAKTSVESQVEGLETGADDYVTKPFNMLLLKTRINNLLETRRLLRERFSQQLLQSAKKPADSETGLLDMPVLQNTLDRDFLEKVDRVLMLNYTDPQFGIELFASEVNMSQRSLLRKIKALTDRTPVQLIADYRLRKVVTQLLDTDINVTDIAFESGFGDLSHFYRVFKKEYGIKPSEYRNINL